MATTRGTNGNDQGVHALNGTADGDLMNGFDGNDELFGNGGNDNMHGDAGNDTLSGGDGNDVLDGGLDGTAVADAPAEDKDTLNGGAGLDTASYAEVQHGMDIELFHGLAIAIRGGSTDTLISIENATGTNFKDLVIGSDVANVLQGAGGDDFVNGLGGNDLLFGGSGKDEIRGGSGKDTMFGGAGPDTFEIGSGDTGVGAARDVVSDFSHTDHDLLQVKGIDASTKTAGDQAFHFIGTAAFSGVAGELHATKITGGFIVAGDVNGDKVADVEIEVHTTATSLVSGDFIL